MGAKGEAMEVGRDGVRVLWWRKVEERKEQRASARDKTRCAIIIKVSLRGDSR